jgi:hypothetical protein
MDKSNNQKDVVIVKQQKEKEIILQHLRKIPIVQIACEKAGVSRATFYRLRAEDEYFKKSVEDALAEGVTFINDMSEAQLITLIKEKNWPSISFWLRSHHPSYKPKDFQASFAITEDGDRTIFEVFADISPETEELRNFYLRKTKSNGSAEPKT